jgi:predicted naringenin-chalcone synthase
MPASEFPRITAISSARPPHVFVQSELRDALLAAVLGSEWAKRPESVARGRQIARLFDASHVERRGSVVDLLQYYTCAHSTGERMDDYGRYAYPLARAALEGCLAGSPSTDPGDISDLYVVSCTGYAAPGLDILLARDLEMPRDVRRVVVGHMGCFGAWWACARRWPPCGRARVRWRRCWPLS